MIKLLIPLLLASIVFADNLVNLEVEDGRNPFVAVEAFTFGNGAYTIMWQSEFNSLSGSTPKTLLWAQGKNTDPAEDENLIVIQFINGNTMRVCFGKFDNLQTISLSGSLSANTLYSFSVVVQPTGTANQVNVAVYVNTEDNPRFSGNINGIISQGTRTATLGARNNYLTNAKSEFMNGMLDNFVIVSDVVDMGNRKSLHSPHHSWSPATAILDSVALWIHFDDAILALENTAVAITKVVNGQSDWVSAVVHGNGIFQSHGQNVGGQDWRTCRSTGDPHYYNWWGQHVSGGEKLLGHRVFQTCDNDDFEIRTHTRMCQWWANSVFRVASIRYKDYVWRVNLDERGNANTRHGFTNTATQVVPGRYMKHVTESSWNALGDSTFIHGPTGAKYQGWSGRMRVSVPDVASFEVHPHSRYMNLYVRMNLARCTERRGTCDNQLYINGNVFFNDLQAPPPLPDNPVPEDDPCTSLEGNPILATMEASCLRYYPSGPGTELYDDCRFDACASGDPDMIPDQDLTPECQLERLTGVDNPDCDLNTCQGACFGRSDCVDGVCTSCDAGFGGFDCYQETDFTCHTASYTGISLNVEPRTVFNTQTNNLNREFTEYSVWSSLLVFPATYQNKEYLQFVANSPDSDQAGSFTVCIRLQSGTASNDITVTPVLRPVEGQVNGPVVISQTSTDVTTGSGLCVDVEFSAYTVGGFYFEIDGSTAAEFLISVPVSQGLTQVLVGSQNNRNGLDVSKVPQTEIVSGFTWDMQLCNNADCYQHDTDCGACYLEPGCGFCQETQRCMSGTLSGPRRGLCENWRMDLANDVSRVVTTKYNGDDLVDPDYEVYLSQVDGGVPVSVFVPTGRTNDNIDVQFMFSTKGTYAVNAEALKSNLLTTLFGVQNALNLGLGYYGDIRSVVNMDLTRVDTLNHYLFARALEAPTGTSGSNNGGQFAALKNVIAQTSYRQFSRRLAVFTVYDIDSEVNLASAREAVLKSDVFPVWAIPSGVSQAVVDYWTNLNNRLDGIPSLVVRIDQSGSDFQSAFRQLFLLSASYPHVVINDITDQTYNHVDQTVLASQADSLSIAGLTNTGFRARFNIPMKHHAVDVEHYVARINIPGFGHSLIEDVVGVDPIITGDRSFDGPENHPCIEVTLAAETFNNLAAPVFEITSLPAVGKLHVYDASQVNAVGDEVTLGYYAQKTFCFVPVAHDHSTPGSAVYAEFEYSATDGCISSNTATVEIYVTPIYLPPAGSGVSLTIKETDQLTGNHDLTVTAFEADKQDNSDQEQVSFTWSGFDVDYLSSLHGAAPTNLFDTVADGQDLVANSAYGPYAVDGNFEVSQTVRFVSPGANFFGTFTAMVTLSDNGNRNVGTSPAYPVVVEVTPVNDAPVGSVVGDDVFDNTHLHQWVMEDGTTALYIIGEDIDNFEIGVDLRAVNFDGTPGATSPTVNGVALDGNWHTDACVSTAGSGRVVCEILYTPAANYYTCGDGAPANLTDITTLGCTTPAFRIEYRINDHNNDGFRWPDAAGTVADAVTATGTLDVHVIAVNDPPAAPPNQNVELVEDDLVTDVTIRVTDIDSTAGQIDLFLSTLCPELITITQQNGDLINEGDEVADLEVKRAFQDHRFRATTIANLHGVDRATEWEICRITTTAGDQGLTSLTNGYVSIRVRPDNDSPYDLLTGFVKAEDYNGQIFNVMDLTAKDIDNYLDDLTYVITQLPFYDLAAGEGVVIHPIDPVSGLVDEDRFLVEADLPYTITLNDANQALVWVRNLANWYGTLSGDDTLIYTVTDIDQFLNQGETGYKVNTVESEVQITIPPVNDRPITTVQPPSGFEDVVQVIFLLGENDKFGEDGDEITVSIQALQVAYSDSYDGTPQLFYHFDDLWYSAYVLSGDADVTGLTPLLLNEEVTDSKYRVLFVPPQHMNKAASKTESPLFIAPQLQYQMTETVSHSQPEFLRSTISDWLVISVNPVNDVPVTWDGEWIVDSLYDEFYGGNDWAFPDDHGDDLTTFDNTVCIDDCYYTEDFGAEGFYLSINPREIKFGGRDIEGDDLQVVIRSADCQADNLPEPRAATFELITDAGRVPVAVEDLVGMTLDTLVKRYVNGEGYKLVSMLTFAPARDDWNVESDEAHENDESGEASSYYCQLTYAVVDSEGLASDDDVLGAEPKTITLQVRQQNDQPTDSVLKDPSQSSTVIGFEDNFVFLKFDAEDVENDDFTFAVTECDNSRGSYFFPSSTQFNHIDADGNLDTTQDLETLFSEEIDCEQSTISNPSLLHSDTEGKGWFVLFVPNSDDYGNEFSSITVAYDDNTVTDQDPQFSERFIDIRSVNDAPVISSTASTTSTNVIEKNSPLGLALSFSDIDAVLQDSGEEFDRLGFQIKVTSAVLTQTNNGNNYDAFTYEIANGAGFVRDLNIIQPTSEDSLGLVNWVGTISQANTFVPRVSMEFKRLGDYEIEVVVADSGRSGYCTPDVVADTATYPANDIRNTTGREGALLGPAGYEDSRCNRVTVATFAVKVNSKSAVLGGIATGAGAGLLAVLALGAVLFAKLKEPEDLEGWEALDMAQMGNTMKSGIHEEAGTKGTSQIFEGANQ